jgi:hypothetical protein
MTRRHDETLARFLEAVAESTVPLDVGAFGPASHYTVFERVRLGPLVNSIAASGILREAGADTSDRPSRKGCLTRKWLADCTTACRLKAAEYRKGAEPMDDDEPPNGPTQGLLF